MSATAMLWTGRVLTGLFSLFVLAASSAPKLLGAKVASEAMAPLGWDARYLPLIGAMELAFVVLHLIPRTNLLGALLMTALLGGAVASQLRAGQPLGSHVLFGVYLGLMMWAGLWLRDPALRALLPWRTA